MENGGKTFEAFLEKLREATGVEEFTADGDGLVSLRVDDAYNLNLQHVEASGRILCFVEVAELPVDAPAAVYRDLLAAGLFGRETAGGYFALEKESETVVYNYFFDLEQAAADVEEFAQTLEKILQLCDLWAERVKRAVHAATGAKTPKDNPPHGAFITA